MTTLDNDSGNPECNLCMTEPSRRTNQGPSVRRLFLSFLRLGSTAFGGPSMVAYIQRLSVDRKQWLDQQTFHDGVAICQTIPGATAMQTAAYVGLRARGLRGALATYIGFGLPAFVLMMLLAAVYTHAHDLPRLVSTFSGLQAVIVGIVANATVLFGRTAIRTWQHVAISAAAAVMFGFRVNPIEVILLAAVLGLLLRVSRTAPVSGPTELDRRQYAASPVALIVCVGFFFIVLAVVSQNLLDLAALMFRIDLFAFGGGYASLPLMFHEVVEVRKWLDGPVFMNGIVLGHITPGPIVITATFVGYMVHGLLGGLVATIAIFSPSFLILVGLVPYFDRLRASVHFNRAMAGILCSFVGLLLTVAIRFAGAVDWGVVHAALAAGALTALLLRVDVLWVVLGGAVASAILV